MAQAATEAFFEHAMMHMQHGDRNGALAYLQEALIQNPQHATAWGVRGCLLVELSCYFDALISFDKALEFNPVQSESWNNRGSALANLGKQRMAMASFEKAIALSPEYPQALENLAIILSEDDQNDKAIELFRKLIAMDPNSNNPHVYLGMMLIKTGRMLEGWQQYEWRGRLLKQNNRGIPFPVWNGESLAGKTILVFGEQGMGDVIQFMRYAPMLKQRTGARVVLEVNFALYRIASKSGLEVDEVVCAGEATPQADYAVSMMSLPMILGTNSWATVPWPGPYLQVDELAKQNWERRLSIMPGFGKDLRVGVCWSGMSRENQPDAKAIDSRRSVQLSQMAELAKVKGITWVSLQKGPQVAQTAAPPAGMTIGVFTQHLDDFYETAALMETLDLIITVDTSVAHLAGAIGKPVWMLSRYDSCWRWGTHDMKNSPWYPTMRIFRQKDWGAWDPVMKEVAVALAELAGGEDNDNAGTV